MKGPCPHPLPLRIWHWLNALIVITLMATGVYLRFHGMAVLNPNDPVLLWHKGMGLAMIMTTGFWFAYNIAAGNLKHHYGIAGGDLRGMAAQARFYLFSIFSGGKNPFRATAAAKYNPLQKLAYGAVMFIFLPVQIITGILFLKILPLRDYLLSANLTGFLIALHVLFAYLVVLFLIVHLYMATLGETIFAHTKAMIVGYEEQGN